MVNYLRVGTLSDSLSWTPFIVMHLFVHTESKSEQGFRHYATSFDPSNVCLDLMWSAYREWFCGLVVLY